VEVAHRGSGVEVALRAVLLDELAGARAGLEDPEGALEAADRALKIVPELPPGSPHRPMLLSNLATTFREVGALDRAIDAYDRALGAVEVEGAKAVRPLEIELLIGRADTELARGDARAAARTAGRAVELAEAHVGEVHAFTVRALWLRADALREVGDPEGATPHYRRSLVAEGQLLGPEHPSVGQKLMALGLHLAELGRYEAARDHLRRAREVFEGSLGPEADPTRAATRALDDLGTDEAG
jgi:tetratricopeptide (TPR) repeat protein